MRVFYHNYAVFQVYNNLGVKVSVPYLPQYDKTNNMTFASNEDSDQPGHPPSLIGVFAKAQVALRLRLGHRPFFWFYHAVA